MLIEFIAQAINDNSERLDEALLSNIFAWMRKCKDDRLIDVYLLLQLLLQKCAARALLKQSKDPADIALNEVRFKEGALRSANRTFPPP